MSFTPDLDLQEQFRESLGRPRLQMSERERMAEALVGGGFVAAAAVLWVERPPGAFAPWPALLCFLLLAVATRVAFDTPYGFTVATQIAFVPLVFALPVALVPPAVVLALLLAAVPDLKQGSLRPSRLIKKVGNAWFRCASTSPIGLR